MTTLLSRLRAPSVALDAPSAPPATLLEALPGCPWCGVPYRPADLERRTCWDGSVIACCPHCQRNVNDLAGAAEIRRIVQAVARDLAGAGRVE